MLNEIKENHEIIYIIRLNLYKIQSRQTYYMVLAVRIVIVFGEGMVKIH